MCFENVAQQDPPYFKKDPPHFEEDSRNILPIFGEIFSELVGHHLLHSAAITPCKIKGGEGDESNQVCFFCKP